MEWRLFEFFAERPAGGEAAATEAAANRALLLLNQPLCRPDHLMAVWRNTSIQLCADGGANRLYDLFSSDKERENFLPTVIRGDLDSLRGDVREFYESKGVPIEKDNDQDTTDFHKCIAYLQTHETNQHQNRDRPMDLLVMGALSGRLDQTLASIGTLFRFSPDRRVYLVSNSSVACLLRPTTSAPTSGSSGGDGGMAGNGDAGHGKQKHHTIYALHGFEGPNCGIASLGRDAHVVTTGLKWNLHRDMVLNFDKLLSTSNAFGEDAITAALHDAETTKTPTTSDTQTPQPLRGLPFMTVTVDTDQPVLWMADVHLD